MACLKDKSVELKIGKKPVTAYVAAILSEIERGKKYFTLFGLGKRISKAVDVSQLVKNQTTVKIDITSWINTKLKQTRKGKISLSQIVIKLTVD